MAAKKRLRIKHVGLYNLFALTNPEIEETFEHSVLQGMTMLNTFGVGRPRRKTVVACCISRQQLGVAVEQPHTIEINQA